MNSWGQGVVAPLHPPSQAVFFAVSLRRMVMLESRHGLLRNDQHRLPPLVLVLQLEGDVRAQQQGRVSPDVDEVW